MKAFFAAFSDRVTALRHAASLTSIVPPFRNPLFFLTFLFGLVVALWGVGSLLAGRLYLSALNYADATTLVMMGILLVRGAIHFRDASPLKALVLNMTCLVSFVFTFEVIYKFLFFGWLFNAAELRTLLMHGATSAPVLIGFVYGDFRFGKKALACAAVFAFLILTWWFLGYPQLFDYNEAAPRTFPFYGLRLFGTERLIPIDMSRTSIWILNRAAKAALFLAFFYIYPSVRDPAPSRNSVRV